jgi:hypothetical protein
MSFHRLLVCGGRTFDSGALLFTTLDELHRVHQFRDFIQGGNRGKDGKPGADRLAREWACTHPEIVRWECKADWRRYGDAAGPIRNKRMLEWLPDLVVGFPGGAGTADMLAQARAAGVMVIEL